MRTSWIAAALLLGWVAGPAAAAELESLRASVVDVSCQDENGNAERGKGLVVGRQDRLHYVLTVRHVARPERPCQVEVQPGGRLPIPARLLDKHYEELDMEVVLFEADPPLPLVPMEIADAEVGEAVSVLIDNRFFGGNKVLSVLAEDVDPNEIVIENEGLAQTYSGSPVFTAQGKWLGLYRAERVVLGRRRGLVVRSEAIARALDFLGVPANLLARGGRLEKRQAFRQRLGKALNDWLYQLLTFVGMYELHAAATIDETGKENDSYVFLEGAGKEYYEKWLALNETKPGDVEEVGSLWSAEMAREYREFFEEWVEGVHERIVFRGLPGVHGGTNGVHAEVNAAIQRKPRRAAQKLAEKRRIQEAIAKVRADLETLRPELQDQINAWLNRLQSGLL